MRQSYARVLPFVAAVLLSVVVLFTPASGVPSAPPGTDKVVHFAIFALLAATAHYARWPTVHVVIGLVGYAVLSEIAQSLLPLGRSGSFSDVIADLGGVLVALGLGTWWRQRAKSH